MSLFLKRYRVVDWYGKVHRLTAKQLYKRIMEDSKSNYNWIASATELVKACNQFDSSEEMYSKEIKVAILNCFANLELLKEYPGSSSSTDEETVYSLYNSLPNTDEAITKVKEKYLAAIISAVVKYDSYSVRTPIHIGPTYIKICDEWKKAKFEEYVSKQELNFNELRNTLYIDFENTIKKAEQDGAFEEDDKKRAEENKKFWTSVLPFLKDL